MKKALGGQAKSSEKRNDQVRCGLGWGRYENLIFATNLLTITQIDF